jgi:hypothetical protein
VQRRIDNSVPRDENVTGRDSLGEEIRGSQVSRAKVPAGEGAYETPVYLLGKRIVSVVGAQPGLYMANRDGAIGRVRSLVKGPAVETHHSGYMH